MNISDLFDVEKDKSLNINLYNVKLINFLTLHEYFTISQFEELFNESLNNQACEIESNIGELDYDLFSLTNRLLQQLKFKIVIEEEENVYIITNNNIVRQNYSYEDYVLTRDIIIHENKYYKEVTKLIVDKLLDFISEDEELENKTNDLSEINTFVSGVHSINGKMISNIKLKDGQDAFIVDNKLVNEQFEEINIDDLQDEFQNVKVINSENNYTEINEEVDQLEELRQQLTRDQYSGIVNIIQLLGNSVTYEEVLHHARDLEYI